MPQPTHKLFETVKILTELPGPVGHEDAVQDWIAESWGRFAEVRRTGVGNVIARIGGSGRKLVLMAHADEICFMVKSVAKDGFLHLWPYFGDSRGAPAKWIMPLNQPALVLSSSGLAEGVFATASGHTVSPKARKEPGWEWNDWFVDLGLCSREEVEACGIFPGSRVIWNPTTRRFGETRITGKAMDDRAALAIATLAGERLAERKDALAYDVTLVSTVQEENGMIGAQSVMDEIDVDVCVNLDVGLVGDIPGTDERDFPNRLGDGPAVVYQDAGVHYSRRLSDAIIDVANRREIPVQRAIYQGYRSDAAELMKRGAEVALLTYPTRYTHSPIETVETRDLESCIDLLEAFALTPTDTLSAR